MSVFLNGTPSNIQHTYPSDTLIHPYNQKIFADLETATDLLMYKVLLPGEVAFAYYNDEHSVYGINAIFAVGPIIHGCGNIIFRNAEEIKRIIETLEVTIADVNTSIGRFNDNLMNMILDVSTVLDQKLADCINAVMGPMNNYQKQIDNIKADIYDININVNTKASDEKVDEVFNRHKTDIVDLCAVIDEREAYLKARIKLLEIDIIERIQNAIKSVLDSSDDKSEEVANNSRNELQNAFKTIQTEYTNLYNELRQEIIKTSDTHKREYNVLSTVVNNLSYELDLYKSRNDAKVNKHESDINEIKEKLDSFLHRFKHHLSECPDTFNKDLTEE